MAAKAVQNLTFDARSQHCPCLLMMLMMLLLLLLKLPMVMPHCCQVAPCSTASTPCSAHYSGGDPLCSPAMPATGSGSGDLPPPLPSVPMTTAPGCCCRLCAFW